MIRRVVLSGGSTELWCRADSDVARAIIAAVEIAVVDESARHQLACPAITFAAQH